MYAAWLATGEAGRTLNTTTSLTDIVAGYKIVVAAVTFSTLNTLRTCFWAFLL